MSDPGGQLSAAEPPALDTPRNKALDDDLKHQPSDGKTPRADGKRRRKTWPYAGEPMSHPDPSAAAFTPARPAFEAALAFEAPIVKEKRETAQEAQRNRSITLLQDDRAKHLVPSIRHAEIQIMRGGALETLRPPSVERAQWSDPTDSKPDAHAEPKRIAHARRANTLRWMQKRKTPLSDDHITAGELLEADWESSHVGLFAGAPPPEIRGAPGPGDYARHVNVGASFKAAMKVVGPLGADLLQHVLLGADGSPPIDLKTWAVAKRINGRELSAADAKGMLIIVLDQLVDHYGRRIRDRQASQAKADRRK